MTQNVGTTGTNSSQNVNIPEENQANQSNSQSGPATTEETPESPELNAAPEMVALMANKGGERNVVNIDFKGDLPDLDDAEVVPFDLSSEYWTPEKEGEFKRVYFSEVKICPVQDQQDKEKVVDLPVAFFFEKTQGEIKTVRNASKRLLACLENNDIQKGTPLQITYMGKKKNSTNNYQADSWKVSPLIINIK